MCNPHHSPECERTESCVDCGAAIKPQKCRCGYWMTRCSKCSAKASAESTKKYVEAKLVEMRADFKRRMSEKYGY